MTDPKRTPKALRAEADRIEQQARRKRRTTRKKKTPRLYTFSHMIMAGIMLMFFVGVGLGVYVTVFRGEPLSVTLDYIMELARIVTLGYFVKAFGENIAKIILSAVFGNRMPDSNPSGPDNYNDGGVP